MKRKEKNMINGINGAKINMALRRIIRENLLKKKKNITRIKKRCRKIRLSKLRRLIENMKSV